MTTILKVAIILITAPLFCNSVCWCTDKSHYACGYICDSLKQRDCGRHAGSHKCQWGDSKPGTARILDAIGEDKNIVDAFKKFVTYKALILSTDYKRKLNRNTLDIPAEMKAATGIAIDLIHNIWDKYMIDNPPTKCRDITFYLLGSGSFGRGEMLPSSDLDVLPIGIGLTWTKKYKDALAKKQKTMGSKFDTFKKAVLDLFDMPFSDLTKAYPDITKESTQKDLQKDTTQRGLYKAIKSTCKSMDVHVYLQAGVKFLKEEMKFLTHGGFAGDAFGIDNYIKEIVVDDVDQLLHHVSKVTESESQISSFGDSIVLYQEGPAAGNFKAIHEKFIEDVPIANLKLMNKIALTNHFDDAVAAQTQLATNIAAYSPYEYKPKYLYIRAYSLLPYWTYIVLLKSEAYPKHKFIYSTPERIKKFVSWKLLDEELADAAIKQFYIQQRWTLVANLQKDTTLRNNPKVYWHDKGFTARSTLFSSGVKARRGQVVSENARKIFSAFGKQMKVRFSEAVKTYESHKEVTSPVKLSPVIEVLPKLVSGVSHKPEFM